MVAMLRSFERFAKFGFGRFVGCTKGLLAHGTEPWTDSLKEVLTVASDPMSDTPN
jgi:hypothetical protein